MSLPDYLQRHIADDTRFLRVPGEFVLESGEVLRDVDIAYRTWGDPANAAEHAVLICHALTGSADVEAWWPNIIGEGRAFDPARDYVICANILGSCYGTTGPVSIKPGTAERYRADFPRISVRDMVELERTLLDELDVRFVELVTGPSLGGMQALEWALMYPERIGSIVPIGVGGRHSPWCIGISEAQRAAIAADPNWNGGFYSDDATPDKGLAAARMMAICTYRSWQSFNERFGRERRDDDLYQVQSYLRHQGAKINEFIIGQGEVYRLLTAMFLHGGLTHLFFNGYALYVIGLNVERVYGHARFLLIYFLGGLTGSLFSLLFSPYASVGASGALFGIFGAEMVFLYRNRKLFGSAARARLNNLLMLLALNLVIGITPGSNIDNWGHVGGLVGGLALSWLIGPIFQPVQPTLGATAIDLRDTNPLEGARLFVPFAALAALVLVVGVMTMTA